MVLRAWAVSPASVTSAATFSAVWLAISCGVGRWQPNDASSTALAAERRTSFEEFTVASLRFGVIFDRAPLEQAARRIALDRARSVPSENRELPKSAVAKCALRCTNGHPSTH